MIENRIDISSLNLCQDCIYAQRLFIGKKREDRSFLSYVPIDDYLFCSHDTFSRPVKFVEGVCCPNYCRDVEGIDEDEEERI